MENKIKFEDESGDKEFFTIIPNYVLNHSTQCDRDVYIQIKRITGESGECYMSQKNLAKQCGISVNRLKKSLDYLIEHRGIINAGTKPVNTKGGNQYVNVYKVANLGELNMKYYKEKLEAKGVSPKTQPLKGVSQNESKGYHKNDKGVSPDDDKEYPINNIHIKEDCNSKELPPSKDIVTLISYGKSINPLYKDWYKNKTQRKAAARLLTDQDIDPKQLIGICQNLEMLSSQKYFPDISSPNLLLLNGAKLVSKIKQEHSSKGKRSVSIAF